MSERSAWFVPGRIEVLGKHTDYAGGRSLLAATEQGITASGRRSAGDVVVISSRGARIELPPTVRAAQVAPPGHWAGYPAAAVARLARNFGALGGAEIELSDNLPDAAGLSSSSALVVAVASVLADLFDLRERGEWQGEIVDRESLAAYFACIENGRDFGLLTGSAGVGTFGGSEDHTAMLCCSAGELAQYRFAPTAFERAVPMPDGVRFVVAVSGVRAEKTGPARDAYNRVSLAASEIVARANAVSGRRDLTLDGALAHGRGTEVRRLVADSAYLTGRLDQFVDETYRIIPDAVGALVCGDLTGFGTLVDQSQAGAERGLGNQVPETIRLQALARSLGAVAASSFGAGFGGSVWALVPELDADAFAVAWLGAYHAEFPDRQAKYVVTGASSPARFLSERSNWVRG